MLVSSKKQNLLVKPNWKLVEKMKLKMMRENENEESWYEKDKSGEWDWERKVYY